MFVLNLTLKACSNVAYGFNHRDYNHDDCVLKGRRISLFLGLLLKKTPSLQDGRAVYHLPVVETTGYIALSLRDREKVDLKITETTELNIMENPVCLAMARRATAGYPVKIS